MEKVKTQIVFPVNLIKRLDQVVKKKERSHFVVEAVEEKLKAINLQRALKNVVGLWKDREDLKTDAGARRFLKNLRESDAIREKRLRKAWRNA